MSPADIANLFRRLDRGDIQDVANFNYVITSPDYIVMLNIKDVQRVQWLLHSGNILQKVELGGNKVKYILSDNYSSIFNDYLKLEENKSIIAYFSDFVNFMNHIDSGFSISLYKVEKSTGFIYGNSINNSVDIASEGCRIY